MIAPPDALDELVRISTDRAATAKRAEAENLKALASHRLSLPALEQDKALADAAFDEKERSVGQKRRESSAAYTAAQAQHQAAIAAEKTRDDAKIKIDKAVAALQRVLDKEAAMVAATGTATATLQTAKDNLASIEREIAATESNIQTLHQLQRAALANISAKQRTLDEAKAANTGAHPRKERMLGWTGKTPAAKEAKAQAELDAAHAALAEIDTPVTGKMALANDLLATQQGTQAINKDLVQAAQDKFDAQQKRETRFNSTKRTREGAKASEEATHAATIQPATDARAQAARLEHIARQAKTDYENERMQRDAARSVNDEAKRKLTEHQHLIAQAEQEDARLKLAREAAEQELQQAEQQAARIRALDPAPAANTAPDASILSGDALENAGKGDNFTAEQISAIVNIFKRELTRPGNWGDNFRYKTSDEANRIEFENRREDDSNPSTIQIIVHPRVIKIKGSMDDKTIQAALIAANAMWGEAGLQINTWNPWLKSRILANADHLHQLGKIKRYKTTTLFGTVGVGFKTAKGEITHPRSTLRLGIPGSTYRHRLDCIAHGIESTSSRPAKWRKLGKKSGVSAAATATT